MNQLPPPSHPNERSYQLLKHPPFDFHYYGTPYRVELTQESVSQEWRLFANEVTTLLPSSGYLLATGDQKLGKNPTKVRLVADVKSVRWRIFEALVKAGGAVPIP